MNRSNIWIHVGIAVVLIAFAAVLGQIGRWRSSLRKDDTVTARAERRDDPIVKGTHDEVLVRFKPGVSLVRIREIASANNDLLSDEIESVGGLTVIDDLDDADANSIAAQYAAMSDVVAYAEPNFQINLGDPIQKGDYVGTDRNPYARDLRYLVDDKPRFLPVNLPNDPMFADQWALFNSGSNGGIQRADLDAIKAWETTKGDHEVVVAVLDSGVDYKHSDLAENMWQRPANIPAYNDDELGLFNDQHGFNGPDRTADPMDDNGHGTHCAGIIGAEGDNGIGVAGINWHVKIMPLKFLGRGGMGTTNDAIKAINYAIDRKKNGVNLRIISASWGSNSYSKALEDTIRAAGDAGILFVAAAGNDSSNNDRRAHYPSNYDLPNVISVAALDRSDSLAGFSNFGAKTVHIAAPGKDILSTWLSEGYREASGTSMATPYVSGIAALIVADQPGISMANLRERLLATADPIPALEDKVATGGRACAANALTAAVNHKKH